MNKPDFISFKDWELLKEKYFDNLEEVLDEIKNGYPIQYLIGNVYFYNSLIDVDKSVLIPRPETEFLVEKIIKLANEKFNKKINIIDLGTGSGCIAIALKKSLNADVWGIDVSAQALDVAKNNAKINELEINFINADMINPLTNNYDIIISNPPYIGENDYVDESVKKYEPNIALFANDNGMYFYKKIISNNINRLNKNGFMAFEIGDNQKKDLEKILISLNVSNFKFEQDLTGRDRYLFIFNE